MFCRFGAGSGRVAGGGSGRAEFLVVVPAQLLLVLHAPVLEPGLDLRLAQVKRLGQLHALGRRQVALLLEAPLQAVQLVVREDGARLPPPALLRPGVGRQQRRQRQTCVAR